MKLLAFLLIVETVVCLPVHLNPEGKCLWNSPSRSSFFHRFFTLFVIQQTTTNQRSVVCCIVNRKCGHPTCSPRSGIQLHHHLFESHEIVHCQHICTNKFINITHRESKSGRSWLFWGRYDAYSSAARKCWDGARCLYLERIWWASCIDHNPTLAEWSCSLWYRQISV